MLSQSLDFKEIGFERFEKLRECVFVLLARSYLILRGRVIERINLFLSLWNFPFPFLFHFPPLKQVDSLCSAPGSLAAGGS